MQKVSKKDDMIRMGMLANGSTLLCGIVGAVTGVV
jgi:hypothetical protein